MGLVGCGGRGIYAGIGDCAPSSRGVQLTAIGDLFPERVAQAPEKIKANLLRHELPVDDIYRVTEETAMIL